LDDRGLREDLGLSDEQVKQLRSLKAENLKQRIRAGAELKIKRLELEEFLAADEPDRALIDQKLAELNSAQGAMTRMRVDHRLAFRDLLTPEQRSKLQDRMRKHMRRGMRGGRRGAEGFAPRQRGPRRGPGFEPGPDRGAPPDFDEPLEEE
jgi:Spy/CpxP family protein refolding chaperone